MKLCTECHWEDWDRVVDIYSSAYDSLPEYINDETTYKIIILEKGVLELKTDLFKGEVRAPALMMLTQKDHIEYKIVKSVKAEWAKDDRWFTIDGRPLQGKPAGKGLYIHDGRLLQIR